MKLLAFLNDHIEEILTEWVEFLHTMQATETISSELALRDHARGILEAIALDIKTSQNAEQQYQKSRGRGPLPLGPQSAASIHGALRQASDFSLLQLSAEFRALRASVLRLWLPKVENMSNETAGDMIRFNEAIDQALAESIVTYSAQAATMRELFLAVLGHDLRTPLFTMALAGEALRKSSQTMGEVSQTGERVRRSAKLMKNMVADLLGYASNQMGHRMPVKMVAADVRVVGEAAIEDAGATYPDTQFRISSEGDMRGAFDTVRLHQLFANLLVNAAQYGSHDKPVLLDANGVDPDWITVKVTNYGQPIHAESLAAIFKPLVQLPMGDEEDTRPRTSLGLGLFIAREIADVHGGELTVQSATVSGTIFSVRLPRIATTSSCRQSAGAPTRPTGH
jgi:signal transduction histidine kinase